ncbi:catalytic subunit of katanin p60 [Chloropicon primus]|uniref:Catalytic subunit of katanin p60 n=1 Tax=Chloropicon primus TaxID=1764295 RepID=A0A5B8MYR9_9CHLO|nr:catalytic subunit of katanin p60 [Chloropicon primus]UPR03752.1 catalytic subunit of katanin p60 [Chloropicon primus]|eukprot:QDZ24544.1 catalytic subunit of katanin p60 [Chloropicon primus]
MATLPKPKSLSLQAIRAESRNRDLEERIRQENRRTTLVLILRFLTDHRYTSSYEKLCQECGFSLREYDACDNMFLEEVVSEFESFYEVKYGRKPKLVKKVSGKTSTLAKAESLFGVPAKTVARDSGKEEKKTEYISGYAKARERREKGRQNMEKAKRQSDSLVGNGKAAKSRKDEGDDKPPEDDLGMMTISGTATGTATAVDNEGAASEGEEEGDDFYNNFLLKPIPDMGSVELGELAAVITRDIYVKSPNVKWEDISGLCQAKQLLKEAVVFPHKFPHLFKGILSPWKGILLYGPPGTGKTMLAKAVATECRTTFFNISASSIISKWRGDSEKLVRVLFQLARYHAPSTIFFDEIDALMMARGGEGEHEASRRMKTELLMQMDGLASTQSDGKFVFVLTATNLPWELDSAMLRRLEKRIYVGLPEQGARQTIIDNALKDFQVQMPGDEIARVTDGFSGSDLYQLCKECAMR